MNEGGGEDFNKERGAFCKKLIEKKERRKYKKVISAHPPYMNEGGVKERLGR
jgi:hypothetical protein